MDAPRLNSGALESHTTLVPISAERVAAVLAERFHNVMPRPFAASAIGPTFRVDHPSGGGFLMPLEWLEEDDRNAADLLELAVGNALNGIQDAVSEDTTEPWPLLASPDRSHVMAPYQTEWRESELHFWYGESEERAAIAFAPVALAAVEKPGP